MDEEKRSNSDLQYVAARAFWERVFLARVDYYRHVGWGDSSGTCAAKDADDALKEWRERWQV
jgi:hypothetical protein